MNPSEAFAAINDSWRNLVDAFHKNEEMGPHIKLLDEAYTIASSDPNYAAIIPGWISKQILPTLLLEPDLLHKVDFAAPLPSAMGSRFWSVVMEEWGKLSPTLTAAQLMPVLASARRFRLIGMIGAYKALLLEKLGNYEGADKPTLEQFCKFHYEDGTATLEEADAVFGQALELYAIAEEILRKSAQAGIDADDPPGEGFALMNIYGRCWPRLGKWQEAIGATQDLATRMTKGADGESKYKLRYARVAMNDWYHLLKIGLEIGASKEIVATWYAKFLKNEITQRYKDEQWVKDITTNVLDYLAK